MTALIWIMIAWFVFCVVCAIAFGPASDRKNEGHRRYYGSTRHNLHGDF